MLQRFGGINLSSRNPEALTKFYTEKLGVPRLDDSQNYDGAQIGFNPNEPRVWIWDEILWGKSHTGSVTLVFYCDSLDQTYDELTAKGVSLSPPVTAAWGGKELSLTDPDGNRVLFLA